MSGTPCLPSSKAPALQPLVPSVESPVPITELFCLSCGGPEHAVTLPLPSQLPSDLQGSVHPSPRLSSSLAVSSRYLHGHTQHLSLARSAEESLQFILNGPPSPCSFLLSFPLLSCCHCPKNLTPGRPLLSNPTFVRPSPLWLCWPSARPKLCSPLAPCFHSRLPLSHPLFAVTVACQELV